MMSDIICPYDVITGQINDDVINECNEILMNIIMLKLVLCLAS